MAKKTPTKNVRASAKRKSRAPRDHSVPAVYEDMLAEAETSSPSKFGEGERVVKKRRVGGRLVGNDEIKSEGHEGFAGDTENQIDAGSPEDANFKLLQTIEVESEYSSDSDGAWEEVNLKDGPEMDMLDGGEDAQAGPIDLVLDIQTKSTPRKALRRKPITAESRKTRLVIHKVHLSCLLHHVYLRNHWCNDSRVQKLLRKLLSKDLISYLNPSEDKSQFQRDRSFMDGLKQASDVFRSKFQPTARGMRRAQWADDEISIPEDIDLPMTKSDFRELAARRQGSRDVGAQLFCALLRSAGVDARLVCSMQPLPFTTNAATSTPQRPERSYLMTEEESDTPISDDERHSIGAEELSFPPAPAVSYGGDAVRIRSKLATRLGRPPPASVAPPPAPPEPKVVNPRPIRESPFPVYWVEAFNSAVQKWISVDPLTTRTLAQPSKLCPPTSDSSNLLSYVVAFEEDYRIRDVTLRYSQAFNAKTRKLRVEDTKGGKRWWEGILRYYGSSNHDLDRDQVEDAELKAKEAREPMPRNVNDFKNHPHFVLERHIKRGEVIHPKRKVGKVNAGKSVELVYRRRDVHVVKSADNWYRLGRDIKTGEQPLKRVRPRQRREATSGDDESFGDDGAGTTLYAPFQTEAYIPPPVFNGQVPKNAFGNIDVYVQSMVPPGGVHITHADTSHAARILGIDYSDAVTGFEFRGRHGTAIVKGAVIAQEFREALTAVLIGLEDERQQEEEARRTLEALRMWKRLLTGLKIRQRIDGYDIEGERGGWSDAAKGMADSDSEFEQDKSYTSEHEDMAGGFMPASSTDPITEPTASGYSPSRTPSCQPSLGMGNFLDRDIDLNDLSRSRNGKTSSIVQTHQLVSQGESEGGGFMVDSDDSNEATLSTTNVGFPNIPMHEQADQDSAPFNDHNHQVSNDVRAEKRGSSVPTEPSSLQSQPIGFSSLLNDDELEDATMLQRLYEAEHTSLGSRKYELSKHDTEPVNENLQPTTVSDAFENGLEELAEDASHTVHTSSPQPMVYQGLEDSVLEHAEEVGGGHQSKRTRSSSLESKGSLLSCDPEDIDAEPDWLE